ncbi:DUF6529 family protein [Actinoplanes sp. RD1]|uniref:DUF6529 family protein n=1 Tax=Actinoplanes sp. RD1 TaxID=3064538 RepID=UPI002740D2EB|nr:DUF6529 family protein [Actinoplanes sp. RD1]
MAVALGVYGRAHTPRTDLVPDLRGKSWLATAVLLLAVVQLLSALAVYGRLPLRGRWPAVVHRWSGRLAFLASLPVAVDCLYLLGFQTGDPRVLAHSLLGCLFYGAFVTKMLVVSDPGDGPPWVLPVAGGLLFTAVTGVWLTSALWFFALG